jgi:hypothetical protein
MPMFLSELKLMQPDVTDRSNTITKAQQAASLLETRRLGSKQTAATPQKNLRPQ